MFKMRKIIENKYKLAIAILSKDFVHILGDLQRLGALDKEGVETINGVFEINIKRNGIIGFKKGEE